MTTTVTAPTTDETGAEHGAPSDYPPVELPGRYQVLPITRIVANPANIRDDAAAIPAIVGNLQQDGVAGLLNPLIVRPGDDDTYVIIDGEQRYLSAIEAGQTHIPAIIRDDLTGDADQIISMLRQVHRKDPTAAQQARGIQQLALDGMSDDDIARRTGYTPDQVTAGRSVAVLDRTAVERTQVLGLDLTQVATVAEFATDPALVDTLLLAAEKGPFDFARAAQEARDERTARDLHDARHAELTASGIQILRTDPSYGDIKIKTVGELCGGGTRLTDQTHATCPGHAIRLRIDYRNQIAETAYCTDWRKHGHTLAGSSMTRSGPMSEAERAERRRVIDNNKAMDAANTVRRAWLTELFTAKTPPKGTARFVADMLTSSGHILSQWVNGGCPLLDELLNVGKKHRGGYVPARASDARYGVIALAALAAAVESQITRTSWRHPDATTARWLEFCVSNSYQVGPVEQLIIDGAVRSTTRRRAMPESAAPQSDEGDTAGPESAVSAPISPGGPADAFAALAAQVTGQWSGDEAEPDEVDADLAA
jgi:ParB family chromosome partitioning protein